MTVRELFLECAKQMKLGNGNMEIVVSDDEEGNGYHDLFSNMATSDDMIDELIDVYGEYAEDEVERLGLVRGKMVLG